jgi:HTH-type transcriptional regulator/antitoxin HigA
LDSAEVLAFLMEQNNLTQSELPEIGSQSHVSKVLSGERNLTRDQIGDLSKRFGVSPAVFYGYGRKHK